MTASTVQSHFLGTLSYSEGLAVQARALRELAGSVASPLRVSAILLGLEHLPVATLGIRGLVETDLTVTSDELRLRGLELIETVRGGQATIHSPGQLVIYPCVNLRAFHLGPRDFVQLIERTTAGWLRTLGISPETDAREPGIFVEGAKLVAFGFKISKGLTSHGLAVNVSNDLSLFDLIRTCGIRGQRMTRLAEMDVSTSLEALFLGWSDSFKRELLGLEHTVLTEVPPAN